jgi:hypothetical protein
MSASRDKSQKLGFVYTNLYELYKKAPNAVPADPLVSPSAPVVGLTRGQVIKAADLEELSVSAPSVREFRAPELLGKRIQANTAPMKIHHPAIKNLKKNIDKLSELHSRLRFMLEELEDLVKE